jgi:excisionase family DNA binding protein
MTFHNETFQRVSVAEAAKILGVSPSTVRRLVKAGKLVGESVLRPQGSAYVVRLPRDASTVVDGLSGTSQPPRGEERSNASEQVFTDSVKSPGEQMMAAWSAAVLTPILAPLVAEITASRQQLVSQAETIGELRAENAALRAAQTLSAAPQTPQTVEPTADARMARLRALAPWVLAVLAIGAVVVLLVVSGTGA